MLGKCQAACLYKKIRPTLVCKQGLADTISRPEGQYRRYAWSAQASPSGQMVPDEFWKVRRLDRDPSPEAVECNRTLCPDGSLIEVVWLDR